MVDFLKLQLMLKGDVEALERIIQTREQLIESSDNSDLLELCDSLKIYMQETQELARYQIHQLEGTSQIVTPRREALQILSGLSKEVLDELVVLNQHIQHYRSQSQLKKGLNQLLDLTSDIDYVADSVKTLVRLATRILAQMVRLDALTD